MGTIGLADIALTSLRQISTPRGDVLHAMKRGDAGYVGFGEAYFSWVDPGAVKAWRRHTRMTLNLVVPVGMVRFVFHLPESGFRIEDIGPARYMRLTVPPGIWFGFKGQSETPSLVLNLADIPHDPEEVMRQAPTDSPFDWHTP